MNKFTEILNESNDFQTIQNHVQPISEILGKENVATLNFGDKVGYILRWNLNFNLEEYNDINQLQYLKGLIDTIDSISSTIKNDGFYDVEFRMSNNLSLRFTPQTQDLGEGYKFIVGQNWRNIIIDYSQVAKFFADRGQSIKSAKINDNEINETSDITIMTSGDSLLTAQFESLFNREVDLLYNEEESINRSITCDCNGSKIYIYPSEESTYVIFNQEV